MSEPVQVIGDGIAATMLAQSLLAEDIPYHQHGDGQYNTPPVVFVHLFQGRTFRRHQVEVQAFEVAVEHWSREPLAQEWTTQRSVRPGDRLHRSADTDSVPSKYRPRLTGPNLYNYGPSFTVSAGLLLRRYRQELKEHFTPRRFDHRESSQTCILATGLSIGELDLGLPWDTNPGRTVDAYCPLKPGLKPDRLYLQNGLHLGGNPSTDGFTLGGRVNSKGQAKNDEKELAESLLDEPVKIRSEWWGKRIANAVDRWPLVGWLNETRFLFAGFGGRAFFWLPFCAKVAVLALKAKNNDPVPPELRADRFSKA